MKFKGELEVKVSRQKNRAGQHPLSIEFTAPDGINFRVYGSRVLGDEVLDAVAVAPGGKYMRHTFFSPELCSAIVGGGFEEESAPQPVNQAYQDEQTAKMNERARKAGMIP